MPEGPEMYRVARKLHAEIAGKSLTEVWFAFEHLKTWQAPLSASRVERVTTLGKALMLYFDSGEAIYTHNQLYGRWRFSAPDRRPDTRRSLRLAISTATRSALLYSASDIDVIAASELRSHPFIARAGLDILSSEASVDEVDAWLASYPGQRRQLGLLLLDQSFLAGVGNYLRSEILFLAGLPPQARLVGLDEAARRRLAEAAHQLMWRSVKTGGITLDAERALALKRAGWTRREYRHFVFDREGQACHVCDSAIERATVSGRRLYRCPGCQPD
ncbi:MAG: endonuclease VIII [Wenzhouxiangella sp.]